MIDKTPYNAGEIRKEADRNRTVMICGHVWWPVEKHNAYHCLVVNKNGTMNDNPQYIWDYTDGKWPVVDMEITDAA